MSATIAHTNFAFAVDAFGELGVDAIRVERNALGNPAMATMFARPILERLVRHIWRLRKIGDFHGRKLIDLLTDPRFEAYTTEQIRAKLHAIRLAGNDASHGARRITPEQAVRVTQQLFDILAWAVATHSPHPELQPTTPFNNDYLHPPAGTPAPKRASDAEVKKLAEELAGKDRELEGKDKELAEQALLLSKAEQEKQDQAEAHARERARFEAKQAKSAEEQAALTKKLEEEIAKLREELVAQQARLAVPQKQVLPPTVSEAQTRKDLIDPQLERAGFAFGSSILVEYPVTGMPLSAENHTGQGYVDYVLVGPDGRKLALVEAKKSAQSMNAGAEQARLYADCLERETGLRPVIFLTNGYHIQLVDDAASLPGTGRGYGAREVEGFPTADQLRTMIARRAGRLPLASEPVDAKIAGRDYQLEMIRNVTEAFDSEGRRRALLVMATGTGKTRVAMALAKLLRGAQWVGRVLFLADRKALVAQACDAFKISYPECAPVNLLEDADEVGEVYFSTYQTMMGLISDDGTSEAKFRPFDFDLIIIDEAHRSIYYRFRRILEYFDSYVVGLTATPKADIHHDTFALFHIDGREPTGNYSLEAAIKDGYLVPPVPFRQDSLFLRAGVSYDDLSPEQKVAWDNQDWGTDEDGDALPPPDGVSPTEINRILYNRDTIRKVVGNLIEFGHKVDGDRLGKTIIFARTQHHADLILEEINKHFPAFGGDGAAVITHSTRYAESAIKRFKKIDGDLRIAISVDMLDTGIDVPEVVNLVFFKPVYSPTKFWQMVGRGTRLSPNLYGPGRDKENFYIFDYCGNVEMFSDKPVTDPAGTRQATLSERLFVARAQLIRLLDESETGSAHSQLRDGLATKLHELVCSVPEGHVLVRPSDRPVIHAFYTDSAWDHLSADDVTQLAEHVAHLPFTATVKEKPSAKQIDLLVLQLQLALLEEDASFAGNKQKLSTTAGDLLAVDLAPVQKHAAVLEQVADPAWWDGITLEDLDIARVVIRELAEFIPKGERNFVDIDFEDTFGELERTELSPVHASTFIGESRAEARLKEFLASHAQSTAMQKLRTARPLTAEDMKALEMLLAEAGEETVEQVRRSIPGSDNLGLFIRRLVGLDAEAVRAEFAGFLDGTNLTANQIGFMRELVSHIVEQGSVHIGDLSAPPLDAYSVLDLFEPAQIIEIHTHIDRINATAEVS